MNRSLTTLRSVLVAATFVLSACSKDDHGHDHPHPHPEGNTPAESDHGHAHSERTELGSVTIGAHTIAVIRVAPIVAGKESDFDLDFGTGQRPAVVRCWIGLESGVGSRKVLFANEGKTVMHGHPEVPNPIPAGSRFFIAIDGDQGPQVGSVAFDR